MVTESRSGQAFAEMAVGLFALTLVLTALFSFAAYIIRSLELQRTLRSDAGAAALNSAADVGYVTKTAHDTVEVERLAADYIFGVESLKIDEKVCLPGMTGL